MRRMPLPGERWFYRLQTFGHSVQVVFASLSHFSCPSFIDEVCHPLIDGPGNTWSLMEFQQFTAVPTLHSLWINLEYTLKDLGGTELISVCVCVCVPVCSLQGG